LVTLHGRNQYRSYARLQDHSNNATEPPLSQKTSGPTPTGCSLFFRPLPLGRSHPLSLVLVKNDPPPPPFEFDAAPRLPPGRLCCMPSPTSLGASPPRSQHAIAFVETNAAAVARLPCLPSILLALHPPPTAPGLRRAFYEMTLPPATTAPRQRSCRTGLPTRDGLGAPLRDGRRRRRKYCRVDGLALPSSCIIAS